MRPILPLFLLPLLFACQKPAPETPPMPNIIYILADDLGYGDLSCLNKNSKVQTPNLDALAASGRIFTDAHSNSAVCSPTRYGVLTGRYAWRTVMKSGVLWSYDTLLIDTARMTVASMLQDQGYHTACIGKWHLGLDWAKDADNNWDLLAPIAKGPNEVGFDYFFGITASLDIPPYVYIENNQATASRIDTVDKMDGKKFWRRGPAGEDFKHIEVLPVLTEKAVGYIHEQAETDNPFFMYFPLPAPHTPILPTDKFQGSSGTNEYGDFVVMVDDVVGQVVAALEEKGIRENTLIIFTSDNGCSPMADFEELAGYGHDPSYIFRGHKADIFEGGHRVPFLVSWPGNVPEGSTSDEVTCLTDLLATAAAITGAGVPDEAGEDSYNMLPAILGQKYPSPIREATVHHSINGSFSIRQGKWKAEFCPGSGGWSDPRPAKAREMNLPPVQLYDLSTDIGEENNVAEANANKVEYLQELMQKYISEGRSTPGKPQANEGETPLFKN